MNIGGWHGIPQHLCTIVYCSTSPGGGSFPKEGYQRGMGLYISIFPQGEWIKNRSVMWLLK